MRGTSPIFTNGFQLGNPESTAIRLKGEIEIKMEKELVDYFICSTTADTQQQSEPMQAGLKKDRRQTESFLDSPSEADIKVKKASSQALSKALLVAVAGIPIKQEVLHILLSYLRIHLSAWNSDPHIPPTAPPRHLCSLSFDFVDAGRMTIAGMSRCCESSRK